MKKGISLFLAALLALTALAGPALGESKTYELPELYLSLDIPEEMMVFTREMAEDDIGLLVLEMTPEQLRQDFESKNVYMNAMSLDPIYEIIVTMLDYEGSQEIFDFNTLSDHQLNEMAQMLLDGEAAQGRGFIYENYRLEKKDQARFMALDLRQEAGGSTIYGRQYYTIFNGQAINITLQSYTGPISGEMSETAEGIMDSLRFTKVLENPRKGAVSAKWVVAGVTLAAAALGLWLVIGSKRKQNREDQAAAAPVSQAAEPKE